MRRGDMVRVHSGEVGFVDLLVRGGTRVRVELVHPGARAWFWYVDVHTIGPDDLTDEECADVMKWKLTHEGR